MKTGHAERKIEKEGESSGEIKKKQREERGLKIP